MKELIKTFLGDIVRKMAPEFKSEILIEISENKENGDYSTNVAFVLAKIIKNSPEKIAQNLAQKLGSQKMKDFSKIEAKSGFVNFFLSEDCLKHQLKTILARKNKYGWISRKFYGRPAKNIQVEFISANPTGPLTIGNGRGGFFGDVLANVLKTQGHKVAREFYINDRGGQVLALGRSIKLAQGKKMDLTKLESDNLYRGDYINDLAQKISEQSATEEAGQKAVELILKTYIRPATKKLGIKYDVWFSEKSLYRNGIYERVFQRLVESGLIYEANGATWMKTSQLGDKEDRVLIKSNGDETYFMSDILYHFNKFEIRKFDKVIDVWGADHHGDVPRLTAALKALKIDSRHLDIVLTQFVRLVSGEKESKVSKRAGSFITLEELIDEVGLGAARFFFLMYSPNTHLDFNMALAKERSKKNPIYYAQYAHARLANILKKAGKASLKFKISNLKLLKDKEELSLIRKLIEFPEILGDISETYEVHKLPRFILELAREFHNFYEKRRVITGDKKLTSARLSLAAATKIVLANSLNLIGAKAPDKM